MNSWVITAIVSVSVSVLMIGIGYLDSKRILKKLEREENDPYELHMLRAEYIENKEKGN